MTAWSGYPNGKTPLSMMVAVRGEYFEPHAAADMIWFENQFAARWGAECRIEEGFRSYETQVYLYDLYRSGRGNLAAYPGTSIHGDGQAVDFMAPLNWYSDQRAWARPVLARCGWIATGENFTQDEPWHFEHPSLSMYAGTGVAIPIEEDMALTDADISKLMNYPSWTGTNKTFSQSLKDLDSIFNAVFVGGASMPDDGKSIGQSLAEINGAVNQPVTREATSQATLLGTDPVTLPQIQDNADTNTLVRKVLEKLGSGAPGGIEIPDGGLTPEAVVEALRSIRWVAESK